MSIGQEKKEFNKLKAYRWVKMAFEENQINDVGLLSSSSLQFAEKCGL